MQAAGRYNPPAAGIGCMIWMLQQYAKFSKHYNLCSAGCMVVLTTYLSVIVTSQTSVNPWLPLTSPSLLSEWPARM